MSSQTQVWVWRGTACRRILRGNGILGWPLLSASLPNSVFTDITLVL